MEPSSPTEDNAKCEGSVRLPTKPPSSSPTTKSPNSKTVMKNRLKATYYSSSPNASRLLHSSRSYNNSSSNSPNADVPNPSNTNNNVDLRELLSLPRNELASKISSILTSNEALRRNLQHLTNCGEKDKVMLKDLERRLEAAKAVAARRKSLSALTKMPIAAVASAEDSNAVKKDDAKSVGDSNDSGSNKKNSLNNNHEELLTVLKRNLADTNSKCSILTKNNKMLHGQLKTGNSAKDAAIESLNVAEKNLKLKESEVGMLKMGLEREKKLKDMAVNDHNMYKERVDNITTNNEYLRKMLEEARSEQFQSKDAREKERNKFKARIEEYERVLSEAKVAFETLTSEKQQGEHKIIHLEDAMASLKSSKNDLESRLNQVKEEYEALRQSEEKHRKEGAEHKEGYEKEKKFRQSSIIKLAEQMQRVSAKEEEAKQWESQVRQLYEVIGKLNGEKEGMEKKIGRLERQIKSKVKQSSDATVNALQDARRGGEEATAILMKEKDRLEKELTEERSERAKAEEEKERHYKEWEEMKKTLKDLERERDSVGAALKAANNGSERALKEKEKEIARLEKRFEKTDGKLQELLSENMVEKNERLRTEIEKVKAEMSRVQLANDGLTLELSNLNEESRRTTSELRDAVGEQRRLTSLAAENEENIRSAKAISKKWEQASVVVKEKMAKVLQAVVDAKDTGKSVEQVLYDVKFVMLGDDGE
ncbi:hypothetical protein TrST_g219 [Triparma strigata]|uniref:Uncharacterized protein n=1 Tax=Triparma strigata TaxID=1606541 RepID=A0A9W7E4X7_9STRA|nr:hypothetical protein TrST_g219 [Triparma strigata]